MLSHGSPEKVYRGVVMDEWEEIQYGSPEWCRLIEQVLADHNKAINIVVSMLVRFRKQVEKMDKSYELLPGYQ